MNTNRALLSICFLFFSFLLVQSLSTHGNNKNNNKKNVLQQLPMLYNEIPYPVAVMNYNEMAITTGGRCNPVSYDLSILTANNSNPLAAAVPLAFSLSSGPNLIAAIDNVRNCLYIPSENMGVSAIASVSLTMESFSPSGPFSTGGILNGFYNVDFDITVCVGMVYSSSSDSIYFLNYNFTAGDLFTYDIISLSIVTGTTTHLNSSPAVSYLESPIVNTMVFNEVSKVISFMGVPGLDTNDQGVGNILTFNTVTNELDFFPIRPTDQVWNCTEWAYDAFSGHIFGICFNGPYYPADSLFLAQISIKKKKVEVTEIGVLYNNQLAEVIHGTFTVDYLTGPAYVALQVEDVTLAVQFDLSNANTFASTTLNNTLSIYWMRFGEWLLY